MLLNQDIRSKYASKHISNVVFYIPFSYYYVVRLGTIPKWLSWAVIYLFPTCYYSALTYQGDWCAFAVNYLLILLATFSLYELGYILNDTMGICREKHPTVRLYEENFLHFARNRWWIILVRILYAIMAIALLVVHVNYQMPSINHQHVLVTSLSIAAILPIFVLYNRWRNRYNVWLYPILVFSRYIPFMLLYSIDWRAILSLFVSFPLINMIERFSMPRYRFPIARTIIPTEQSKNLFRVGYYTIMAIIACALIVAASMDYRYIIPIAILWLYRIAVYIVTLFHQPKNYLNG